MFDRPILFYSNYCIHSTNYINALVKHPEIFESFIRINIDIDPETKSRPAAFYEIQSMLNCKIAEIPTIVVSNGEYVLTGVEAFKWLEHQISSTEENKELIPFNPIEMGSFSDSYASYGSNDLNDAKEQTFKFIGKEEEKINTPQETSGNVSKDDLANKQHERESFTNMPQQKLKKMVSPQQIQQQQFNQQQFNQRQRAGKLSNKQKDFDQRLQQMIMDRESLDPPTQKINANMIDFQSGNITM